MSINVSQIFVRYPDPQDAADLLADRQRREPATPAFIVARTPGPWLSVASADNAPPAAVAQALSRALEASAVWFGLAGHTLAYRYLRYSLGREEEAVLEPAEIFRPDTAFVLPAYRDVESELYDRLKGMGLPADYLYLFFEELGMRGGDGGAPDAALVRQGSVEPFRHRIPRRAGEGVRTLFDDYREEEHLVCETIRLRGSFDEARARQLFATLESVCRRRNLPEGWKVRYVAEGLPDPDLGARLAGVHARGGFSYEFVP